MDLIVDPALSTRALEQLALDALANNSDAEVLSVDIYDSTEAATYDRHRDGGALAQLHLVASARVHAKLGIATVSVRGVEVDPERTRSASSGLSSSRR